MQAKYEEFREATLKSVASTCEALHEGLESALDTGTEITNMTPSASPDLHFKTTQRYSLKSPSDLNSD